MTLRIKHTVTTHRTVHQYRWEWQDVITGKDHRGQAIVETQWLPIGEPVHTETVSYTTTLFRGSVEAYRRQGFEANKRADALALLSSRKDIEWQDESGAIHIIGRVAPGPTGRGNCRELHPRVDTRPYSDEETRATNKHHCHDCDPSNQGKRCQCSMHISPKVSCFSQRRGDAA